MKWQDRSVLVTGATGLVGSKLTARLIELGANVVAVVRDLGKSLNAAADARVIAGDIRDQALMERALGDYEVKTVFHLAAQAIVPVASRNPVETLDSNIRGTWSVLEACHRSPCVSEIVVASSDKAYGTGPIPSKEEYPLLGRNPYDASKVCVDVLAQMYRCSFGLNVGITRCGNFFGPGDLNWSRLVPGTLRSIIRCERPVIRSSGRFKRDYMFVLDGVEAYLAVASYLNEPGPFNRDELFAFNFSYENPQTVLEMVERIALAVPCDPSKLNPEILDDGHGEILDQYLSAERARTVLGWKPKFGLLQGMASTAQWYTHFLRG